MSDETIDDELSREWKKSTTDFPLASLLPPNVEFFHATSGLKGIVARGEIVALSTLLKEGVTAPPGFGHSGADRGDNHIALTSSIRRGVDYFTVLLALAGIAEKRVSTPTWIEWYLRRWGDPLSLLKGAAHELDLEFEGEIAAALKELKITFAYQEPSDIQRQMAEKLQNQSITEQLRWLFALDKKLMSKGNVENGLGIVESDAQAWSSVRISDVALLRVDPPDDAYGRQDEHEEEWRVQGPLTAFTAIATGPAQVSLLPKP